MIIQSHPLSPMNPPAIKGLNSVTRSSAYPSTRIGASDVCWFCNPQTRCYNYHKPNSKIVCEHQLNHLKSTINPIQSLFFLDKSPCFYGFSYGFPMVKQLQGLRVEALPSERTARAHFAPKGTRGGARCARMRGKIARFGTRWCPPSDVCWFISPIKYPPSDVCWFISPIKYRIV